MKLENLDMRYFFLFCFCLLCYATADGRELTSREMSAIDNLHVIDKYDDGTVEIICIPPDCNGAPVSVNRLSADKFSVERVLVSGEVVRQPIPPPPVVTPDPIPDPTPDPNVTMIEIKAVDFASNSGWSHDGTTMTTTDAGVLHAPAAGPLLRYDISTLQGQYFIWVLGRGPSGNSDSIYFGTDGLVKNGMDWWTLSSIGQGGWIGDTREGGRALINVIGGQSLDIWAREDGFSIEKIILTSEEAFRP